MADYVVWESLHPLDDQQIRNAIRQVQAAAIDLDDAHQLLAALGLDEGTSGTSNGRSTPHGQL